MKHLITILTLLFALNSSAQITLEHTYTNGYCYSNNDYFIVIENNNIKLYNSNHSLNKTVNLYAGVGETVSLLSYDTKHLFNSDNLYEFLILFNGPNGSSVAIFSEDGTKIKEYAGASSAYPRTVDGQSYLFVYYSGYTEIYSLPGTVKAKNITNKQAKPAFPNPATNHINIPYTLEQGEQTELYILNQSGQTIRQYTVDSNFNTLKLDISDLSAGTYYYKINGLVKPIIVL